MAQFAYDVAPPRRYPRVGGLRSVVEDVRLHDRGALGIGVEWIQPVFAFPTHAIGTMFATTVAGAATKTGQGLKRGQTVVHGVLYAGVEIILGSMTEEEAHAEARQRLEDGLDQAIEKVVYDQYLTTITPTGTAAANAETAIARAEAGMDVAYPGRPLLWINRSIGTLQAGEGTLRLRDDVLETDAHRTPVISSGFVTSTSAVWITPSATLWLGAETETGTRKLETNRLFAIAERSFAVGFDSIADPIRINIA